MESQLWMRIRRAKMSNPEVERSIEAILMVVDEPVSEVVLAQVL